MCHRKLSDIVCGLGAGDNKVNQLIDDVLSSKDFRSFEHKTEHVAFISQFTFGLTRGPLIDILPAGFTHHCSICICRLLVMSETVAITRQAEQASEERVSQS